MTTGTFAQHCRELARQFLQTAIVVDDEAFMLATDVERARPIVEPTRGPSKPHVDEATTGSSGGHSLDSKGLIDSFAKLGVICGVIGPTMEAMHTIRQADIVVLDWRLKAEEPEYALELLKAILTGAADRNALRLVAFYTGEAELAKIQGLIVAALTSEGLDPRNEGPGVLTYGHGRIVLYAKPSVNLPGDLRGRQVDEVELPDRLVDDFSKMTAGLLPGIALVSLTAVRECAHMVLDRFCPRLDPAFLAQRACLPNPDDAERQMVNHVAEELRGLMDYAVADQSPAGESAVAGWIRDRAGDPPQPFQFDGTSLTSDEAVALAKRGLEKQEVLGKRKFECLSTGFAGGNANSLDEELAWIITSRTVFNAPPPTLWLGTVVASSGPVDRDGMPSLLICLRPRCDSVRLNEPTSFAFLPLEEPRQGQEQLIVKLNDSYERRGIGLDASGWRIVVFEPDKQREAVVARRDDSGAFVFVDAEDNGYRWLGELKAEFAQQIAQRFAETISRVAVDNSEWLRRIAR